jgi:hypothetical protein
MTVPIWPSDLPTWILVDTYKSAPSGNRLVTEMDAGPAKQRRRGPKMRSVTCGINLNSDERARFDRFWDEDLKGGVLPFWKMDAHFDLQAILDESSTPITAEDDSPILVDAWWLAQMGKTEPVYSALGAGNFKVEFEIVVLP